LRDEDVKYFSDFLSEFQKETDRGAALVGAALVDSRLEALLRAHFIDGNSTGELLDGGSAPLGTLSSRIKLCHSLGLITELEYKECETIRRVRNEFAHRVHGLTFQDDKLRGLCNNLKANTPDGKRFDGNPRQLFINSVILLSLALWYRPEYAAKFKAEQRVWSWQLSP
jgi:mannitol operon repressor